MIISPNLSRRRATLAMLAGAFAGAVRLVPAVGAEGPKPSAVPSKGEAGHKAPLKRGSTPGTFDFETERMTGTLRLDDDYHGVTRLTDKRTGRQVVDERYSLLNLFRIFAVDLGLGTPRSMKGTVEATADSAQVTWGATEVHLGEITARYEVREPDVIDLTVTVRSRGVYPGYEILMPSYFARDMLPYVHLKSRQKGADWVLPYVNDVYRGGVLAFPRDELAARRFLDGRWSRREYGMPTVSFYPLRPYAEPLGMMTDPDKKVGVVLMADRRHCSGVSARYHADRQEDRPTTYSAIDLTLFGDDLLPGDERSASVRLALVALDGDLDRALGAYQTFASEKSTR